MGKLKRLALAYDECREHAVMDLGAAKLLSDALLEVGELDPTDREKTAFVGAVYRGIDALEAQAATYANTAARLLSTLQKLGADCADLEELQSVLDTIRDDKAGA